MSDAFIRLEVTISSSSSEVVVPRHSKVSPSVVGAVHVRISPSFNPSGSLQVASTSPRPISSASFSSMTTTPPSAALPLQEASRSPTRTTAITMLDFGDQVLGIP